MSDTELMAQGVGGMLRHYRKRAGLSQEKLAFAAGVSREVVRRAESGLVIPEWRNLERFAGVLGITLWDLLPRRPEDDGLKTAVGDSAARNSEQTTYSPEIRVQPPNGRKSVPDLVKAA